MKLPKITSARRLLRHRWELHLNPQLLPPLEEILPPFEPWQKYAQAKTEALSSGAVSVGLYSRSLTFGEDPLGNPLYETRPWITQGERAQYSCGHWSGWGLIDSQQFDAEDVAGATEALDGFTQRAKDLGQRRAQIAQAMRATRWLGIWLTERTLRELRPFLAGTPGVDYPLVTLKSGIVFNRLDTISVCFEKDLGTYFEGRAFTQSGDYEMALRGDDRSLENLLTGGEMMARALKDCILSMDKDWMEATASRDAARSQAAAQYALALTTAQAVNASVGAQ